jgi:hypothetical protein
MHLPARRAMSLRRDHPANLPPHQIRHSPRLQCPPDRHLDPLRQPPPLGRQHRFRHTPPQLIQHSHPPLNPQPPRRKLPPIGRHTTLLHTRHRFPRELRPVHLHLTPRILRVRLPPKIHRPSPHCFLRRCRHLFLRLHQLASQRQPRLIFQQTTRHHSLPTPPPPCPLVLQAKRPRRHLPHTPPRCRRATRQRPQL